MVMALRFMVLFSWTLTLGLSSPSFASSKENWSEWQQARTLFDSQQYDAALREFQSHPQDEPNYYYNLGTTYFKLGRTGAAVAYLEKANHQGPHDPDTQYNLSIARAALGKSIGSDKLDPASSWAEQISDRVSLDEIRGTLGLLGVIVVLLWTRAYLKTRSIKKAILQPAGFLGILGLGITAGIYGIQRWTETTPPAVSLSRQAVRSGPGDHYLEMSFVEGGSKIRLLGPSVMSSAPPSGSISGDPNTGSSFTPEVWRQIRYSDDGIGWVRASGLLAL